MKIAFRIALTFSFILCSLSFAETTDTMTVRLKSGANLRGMILSGNGTHIVVASESMPGIELAWDDIAWISSSQVYDSLLQSKQLIVLPAGVRTPAWIERSYRFSLMLGREFQYHRGMGVGMRNSLQVTSMFSAGLLTVVQFGDEDSKYWAANRFTYSTEEYLYAKGPVAYWGPELALSGGSEMLQVEVHYSLGQAIVKSYDPDPRSSSSGTDLNFYQSIGAGVKINTGSFFVGLDIRSLTIESVRTASVFLTLGN